MHKMKSLLHATLIFLTFALCDTSMCHGADLDVLICKDGEKFVGHLVSSKDSSVTFKSDAAGQLTIDWSKIQELHSTAKFAVLPKGVKLHGSRDAGTVPQGTVAVVDQQVQVSLAAGAAQTEPLTNVAQLVEQAAFQKALTERSFLHGWNGGATVGIAYTNSTQKSQSYSAAFKPHAIGSRRRLA